MGPKSRYFSLKTICSFFLVIGIVSACVKSSTSDEEEFAKFVHSIETKYKRDGYRNPVDLHFNLNDGKKVNIVVTYVELKDKELAESISVAAESHIRRLSLEQKNLKSVQFEVIRTVQKREKSIYD